MTMASLIKNTAKAGVIALALGGAAITAMPAQAASPNFSFSFSVGNGHGGIGRGCLTDPQVRRGLRQHGYDNIRFIDRRGRVVTVRAEKGRRDFRVTVDSCTGRIVNTVRFRGR